MTARLSVCCCPRVGPMVLHLRALERRSGTGAPDRSVGPGSAPDRPQHRSRVHPKSRFRRGGQSRPDPEPLRGRSGAHSSGAHTGPIRSPFGAHPGVIRGQCGPDAGPTRVWPIPGTNLDRTWTVPAPIQGRSGADPGPVQSHSGTDPGPIQGPSGSNGPIQDQPRTDPGPIRLNPDRTRIGPGSGLGWAADGPAMDMFRIGPGSAPTFLNFIA